ncbi:universal stress protein [Halobium salinum]|uniref:Universal stress protein n=1 Tax=Halobium salinum TaxID=1364940 RepID=A0ABD5PGG0_9EURY|nr:universal stress protein [Halobium salinum]
MYTAILVPTDGSKAARRAAEHAVALAAEHGATVHALYAVDMGAVDFVAVPSDIGESGGRMRAKGEKFVGEVAELAESAGVDCLTVVKKGSPEDVIARYVAEGSIDLVVMGKRGRGDPDKPLFGSTTKRVIGRVDVPVQTL